MSEWSTMSLGQVCKKITDGSHYSPKECSNGIPMFSVKDMTDSGFNRTQYKTISEIDFADLTRQGCKPELDDILIAKDGSVLKHVFRVKNETDYVVLSSIAILRPNQNFVYPQFLVYAIKNPSVIETILTNYVSGSGVPRIILKDFKKVEIQVPSLSEQQAIAEVLSSLDDKIDLLHRNNKTLEEIADIQFQQMNNDCTDADLIDEFEISMGQSPPGTSYNEDCVGIEFYQGCTDFGDRFPTPRVYCTDPKRFAKKFDVLLSVRAPVGDINIAFNDCSIGRGLAALRHRNSEVHYSYAYRLLKSIRVAFDLHEETGTIFGSIGKEDLYKIKCPKLTTEGVSKYNTKIAAFEDKITSNELQIKCLASVRDLLLPKLMSGALRVKDLTNELIVL